MLRSRIAAVVAAGTLALGGGVALAQTAPDDGTLGDDTVEDTTVEETVEEDTTVDETTEDTTVDETTEDTTVDDTTVDETTGDETAGDEVATDGEESLDGDAGTEDEHDSHGAMVSAAAQDHSHDEACGNHGAWVSHWARTGEAPACAGTEDTTGDAGTEETAGGEDTTDDNEVVAATAPSGTSERPGNGNAKHGR